MEPALRTRRLARLDLHTSFSSSDDNAMLKYIIATHSPDGTYFDIKPFLEIIENIVHTANQSNQAELGLISKDVKEILEVMALTINKVSCEISSKCIGGGDAHTTTMGILNMLSDYAWDAKAVITLSAFAVSYGEFWLILVARLYYANPLAKWLTRLKKMSDVLEGDEDPKLRFEGVSNLMKALYDLIGCIVEIKELPEQYISPETPELVMATTHIPSAVYWIIRSIVACASILINLIGKGQEHSMKTTDWELSSLGHKISNFEDSLRHLSLRCYQHIVSYQTIHRILETSHRDNVRPLKHLIYLEDDLLPLYESSTKNRVSTEILKDKIVLLLISNLDLSKEELRFLSYMYSEARQRIDIGYEVVWLPMVPNDSEKPLTKEYQRQFEELKEKSPWYSVYHPSLLKPAVIKYIKMVWHFKHKPLLVVMDRQGKIVNTNALHMMWIWGNKVFPFTSQREEALWKEETWSMELLADGIEPGILKWIADERYICLYGGEDIEWIRKFTRTAQEVACEAKIPLEMLYVGKSKAREKVRKIKNLIQEENLSRSLPDLDLIWYFWVRLRSMLHSKSKRGKSKDTDPILHAIDLMLTYDSYDRGWAVMSRGSNECMRPANGEKVLIGLTKYHDWKDNAHINGFLPALNDYLIPPHSSILMFPGTTRPVPDTAVCTACGRLMQKFVFYRCCVE